MSNCDGIRISQLPTMTFVGEGDYIVVNDNNLITKKIAFSEFITSINLSTDVRLATYASNVLLVSPGGTLNPLWNKYPGSPPVNQENANDKFLYEIDRLGKEQLQLNIRITELEQQDGRYATKSYVDQQILIEKTAREGQDDVLMNIKADKYNHYTKAEIDQMLDEIILEGGGIPDAPKDGVQYGRQDETWTEIESLTDAPDDGTLYGRKDGTWTEIGDGVTDLGLDQHTDTTLDITSSTGTDVTIPAASNVLAGLMTAADKVALGNAAAGTNLNIANRDADSLEVTSDTGDDALIPAATTTLAGLMTAQDKVDLNSAVVSGGVAGANTQIQFNKANAMGASPDLTFDESGKIIRIAQTVEVGDGLVSVKTGTGNPGAIDLYCEVGNAHRVRLQSPAHGTYAGNLSFTLPSSYPNAGEVLTASATGEMSWTTIPPGYSDADVDAHLNSASATSGQVLSWTGATYNWITPFDGDYNSLSNLPTIPPAYGDADVDAHLNKNTANQDQVLSWNGTDYEWQTPATSMNFQGTVDLTDGSTVPAGPDSDGDTYTNVGTGTIDAAWVTASDQSGGTAVAAGDLVIYNTDDSLYHYVPTGGSTPPTDLAVANKTGTTLDITSSTGADATVPAVTSTEAGLMTAADKVSLDALAGATDYGDDDVEALFQAYDFHLLPGTNGTYDIGSAEKKVRHLYLSDNSLRFVTDGDVEFPLSVDAPNLFFNSKQVAMVEDIKGGDISTDDNPPATPEDGDLWFNPNTGTLYIYYTDDNSSQWVEIAGPGGEAGDGASVTVSPNPPVGEQGDLWFNSDDGSLYIFYVDGNSSQWIAIASSGGAGGDGASVSVQPGPPSGAQQGDLWWNTNDGYLYVYYEDGNSNQWVTASPPSEGGGGSGETPDLQAVTDAGRFTNRTIDIGNVSGDPNIRLSSDGSATFADNLSLDGTNATLNIGPSINGSIIQHISNTGFLNISARENYGINFSAGSTERMVLNNVGNLNIGGTPSTSPNISLNANGSANFAGNVTSGAALYANADGVRSNSQATLISYAEDGSTATGALYGDGKLLLGNSTSDPNITLNADGSGTFAGTGIFRGDIVGGNYIGNDAARTGLYWDTTNNVFNIKTPQPATNNSALRIWQGTSPGAPTVSINSNGTATFNGQVDAGVGGGQGIGIRAMSSANGGGGNAAVQAQNTADGDLWIGLLANGTQTSRIASSGAATFAADVVIGGNAENGTAQGVKFYSVGGQHITRDAGQVVFNAFSTGNSTPTIQMTSDGNADFKGVVTFDGTIGFNLEPDNPANFNAEGEYTGPTLNVKDRLTNLIDALTSLKTAAASATDLDALKAAIATSLANF